MADNVQPGSGHVPTHLSDIQEDQELGDHSKRGIHTLVVQGLRRSSPKENEDIEKTYTVHFDLHESKTLPELWQQLESEGYGNPNYLSDDRDGVSYNRNSRMNRLHPYNRLTVVDGPSSHDQINIDEALIAHANREHGAAFEFNIADQPGDDPLRPTKMISNNRGLSISFQRTPRMPDDNRLHQLPGSLGAYDLFNVGAYANRLPENIVGAGGVFLPMWQREAMWIDFDVGKSVFNQKYAVRVFVGRVNAVSGLMMDEAPPSSDGQDPQQDYIVLPGQEWLDGICVAPGVVRQFVAMPLGSGYTVEGQKTKEEKHGGLQIEIIPDYQQRLRWWHMNSDPPITLNPFGDGMVDTQNNYNELKAPRELGLHVGDIIRAYPPGVYFSETSRIKDLFGTRRNLTLRANYPHVALKTRLTAAELSGLYGSREAVARSAPTYWGPTQALPSNFAGLNLKKAKATHLVEDLPIGASANDTHPSGANNSVYNPQNFGHPDLSQSIKHHHPVPSLNSEAASSAIGPPIINSFDEGYGMDDEMPFGVGEPEDEMGASLFDDESDIMPSDVEVKDLKAMGLAAGGKLIQDIYKDRYPSTIWNHAAARIINVHILDPVSCEKVTHIVPIPPSTDAKAYAEAGGQFYVVEEKVDDRVKGGDFADIKSVSQMDKKVVVTTEEEFDPLKPKMCTSCELRLCDCIVRPCDHQFCNICIKALEQTGTDDPILSRKLWECPTCKKGVSHVAGFSAPMNLPGEEPMRIKVPVNVLQINDGRIRFQSTQRTRI